MKIPLVLLLTFGLAGCVTASENKDRFDVATKQCNASNGTLFEKTKCINAAEDQIYSSSRYPDLRKLRHAIALDLAGKVDRKEITGERAEAELALVGAQIEMEVTNRDAAAMAQMGRSMQAAGAALQSINPTPSTVRVQTSCTANGPFLNCM